MLHTLFLAIILQIMSNQPEYRCNPANWVDQYADQLYRFALVRINNTQLAEDLVQDTFVSALDRLKTFRGDCSEKSWLYTILRNKIIDYYRSSEKKMSSKFYDINDNTGADRYFYSEGKHAGEWVPEQAPVSFYEAADQPLERKEFMRILEWCMEYLPDKWSQVFRLKNMEELSSNEICKELAITPSNLWVIIHRAKLQLRECMENKWTV